jgi:hypothetical protein
MADVYWMGARLLRQTFDTALHDLLSRSARGFFGWAVCPRATTTLRTARRVGRRCSTCNGVGS